MTDISSDTKENGIKPASRPGPTAGLIRANPTPKQTRQYRRELRKKADNGDVTALGFIVLSETLREQRQQQGGQ